jgi:hypothetical protein
MMIWSLEKMALLLISSQTVTPSVLGKAQGQMNRTIKCTRIKKKKKKNTRFSYSNLYYLLLIPFSVQQACSLYMLYYNNDIHPHHTSHKQIIVSLALPGMPTHLSNSVTDPFWHSVHGLNRLMLHLHKPISTVAAVLCLMKW